MNIYFANIALETVRFAELDRQDFFNTMFKATGNPVMSQNTLNSLVQSGVLRIEDRIVKRGPAFDDACAAVDKVFAAQNEVIAAYLQPAPWNYTAGQ